MEFTSTNMTHFKKTLPDSHTMTNPALSKAQKMKDHLVAMLENASDEIERVQHEPDSSFTQLVEDCGSEKRAKLSFIEDRFDTVITPWLEINNINPFAIDQFRVKMTRAYAKILNRASINASISISTEFGEGLRSILAQIDVAQEVNPSLPGMYTCP